MSLVSLRDGLPVGERFEHDAPPSAPCTGAKPTAAGPAEEHLAAVVESVNRATDLVTARTQLQAPLSPAGVADAAAAQTRLMHTLYFGAHGVSLAVRGYLTQMESRLADRERVPVGDSLIHARHALTRVSRHRDGESDRGVRGRRRPRRRRGGGDVLCQVGLDPLCCPPAPSVHAGEAPAQDAGCRPGRLTSPCSAPRTYLHRTYVIRTVGGVKGAPSCLPRPTA